MSQSSNVAGETEAIMMSPDIPTHRSLSPHSALQDVPTAAASGLLTPPRSISPKVKLRFKNSPAQSIDLDHTPPYQPSLSAPASPSPASLEAPAPPVLVSTSTSRNPFDSVAIETIQHIASLVDGDSDLVHFRQSCKLVDNAIEGDRCSFWRRRFLSKFERPRNFEAKKWNNVQYKVEYQHRRSSLKCGAVFKLGKTEPERRCLKILRDLINDSFAQQKHFAAKYPGMIYEDRNLVALERFCQNENILRSLFDHRNAPKRLSIGNNGKPEPLLQAVQTLMAPLILGDICGLNMFNFPASQQAAYSPVTKQPIFQGCYGTTVNMEWVLHQINFWKYHFTRESESSCFDEVGELELNELPQLWNSRLSQDQEHIPSFGKMWKGISGFLAPEALGEVREEDGRDDIQDEFSGASNGGYIQDMKIRTGVHKTPANMTTMFKDALNLHMPVKRSKTRSDQKDDTPIAEPRTFVMENLDGGGRPGSAAGTFQSDGWFTQLPSQNGFPGWQRMTMMKYWHDDSGFIALDSLWAYEGVMLPGGRVIIGRWWSPDEAANTDMQYSGPCFMWNTE